MTPADSQIQILEWSEKKKTELNWLKADQIAIFKNSVWLQKEKQTLQYNLLLDGL